MEIVKIPKLDYVDHLRGIAILLVILVHTSQKIIGFSTASMQILQIGQTGVQLFFIASAYTLCISYKDRQNESLNILSFFIRRVFRIAPLYYTAILFYFIFSGVGFYSRGELSEFLSKYTFNNLTSNIFFLHGFYQPGNNVIVPGGWSIGTEMAFYAVFPLLFKLFVTPSRQQNFTTVNIAIGGSIICLALHFLLKIIINDEITNNSFSYFNLANQFPVFMLGIYAYTSKNESAQYAKDIAVNTAIFIIFILICEYLLIHPENYSFWLLPIISGVAFISLLKIFRIINFKLDFLKKIGQMSFSIYIFHFAFVRVIPILISKITPLLTSPYLLLIFEFLLTTYFTYLLSVISSKYIEKKGILFGSRLILYYQRQNLLR